MKENIFWAISLCAVSFGMAQEMQPIQSLDSVYIDSKALLARKNSGKVVATITSEALKQRAGNSLAQIVNEISGVEINGSRSNDGQNLGYFIRGGRNRQVVFVVDGVQLNDPSGIANDFDLRLVSPSNIERIEIVKGASSVLYGSGAATAVISITTKKTAKKNISAGFTSILGTNRATNDSKYRTEAITNSANVNGTIDRFTYQMDFSHRYSNGLSAISAPEGEPNFEPDTFNRYNVKADLGYHVSENIKIRRFIAIDNFTSEFDDFSYVDANNRTQSEQLRTGGHFEWNYKKGRIVVNDNHSWLEREIVSRFPAMYDAQSSSYDAFGSYRIYKNVNLIAGVNGNISRFNSFTIPFGETEFVQDVDEETANFNTIDPYVNATFTSQFGLNLNAGLRWNNHSNYGNQVVYNVNPSFGFDLGKTNLKVLASYSTAFITPSLFQLYDPLYGNTDLEPEENTTLEAGLEVTRGSGFRFSAIYFNRDETNFVDFVTVDPELFIFQYQNISQEFTASGVEVELVAAINKELRFSANYTYTRPDDRFSLRIPEHKANARFTYFFKKKTNLGLSYQYTGERKDVFFDPNTFESTEVILERFSLINFDVRHPVSENVTVFAAISNLLDTEYEELFRFQTLGRNIRAGFTLQF